MSDPDEPATETEPDNSPVQSTEPERAESVEAANDKPAKPARVTFAKPPRRQRKRGRIRKRAAVALTKVRRSRRSRYQLAVGAAAALAIIGVSVYAFQDRPSGRGDQANPGEPASAPPAPAAYRDQRVDPSQLTVTETGEIKTDRRTLRVVSARMDLTGKEQLAWAADNGRKVGDVRCTRNFRFNPRETPKERPTTLMCWRTSKDKSVYAIAVDLDKRPSDKELAKTVDKTWAELG